MGLAVITQACSTNLSPLEPTLSWQLCRSLQQLGSSGHTESVLAEWTRWGVQLCHSFERFADGFLEESSFLKKVFSG